MKPYAEEDAKDGRHFPTDAESQVLVRHLQIYFSHPERSIQRSRVVQNVVAILSQTNKHWNQRRVRLWFNNNKKVYYRPPSPVNPEPRIEPIHQFQPQQHPFFLPARSYSVMSLNRVEDVREDDMRSRLQCVPPPPMAPMAPVPHENVSLAMTLATEYERMNHGMGAEDSETRVTDKIRDIFDRKCVHAMVQCQGNAIHDLMMIEPGRINPAMTVPVARNVLPFELIECSTVTPDGEPLVVVYNRSAQTHVVWYKGMTATLSGPSLVSSVVYDREGDVFWLHAGCVVKGLDGKKLSEVETLSTGGRSRRSAMTFCDQNRSLVVASESKIWRWSRTASGMDEVSMTLPIRSITSLTTVGEKLVVASAEYHTAHVYAQNGARVARMIGHLAGITALHEFNENCFLSGSADQSVKLWDLRAPPDEPVLRTPPEHEMYRDVRMWRHGGIITALYGDCDTYQVLSGGTDGMLRGWDVRAMDHKFTMSLGYSAPQSLHYSPQRQLITAVVSERVEDMYYDLEKFGTTAESRIPVPTNPTNAVLTYNYS